MNRTVSIFCCGVQKSGTTSLYAHFCEHPCLSPPVRKELHFFDDETQDWSAPDYSTLESCFANDDDGRLRFDITPIYIFWPDSIDRIRAYNPSAKLIFLFRDPFERAWSQWCMEYARGVEILPFAKAIREGRDRLKHVSPRAQEWRAYSYLERGFYSEQVGRVVDVFPREQLLFLRSQDFLGDYVATLGMVSTFLGIPPFPRTGPKREFVRTNIAFPSVPTEDDRTLVAETLLNDLTDFARLTGLVISDWPTMQRIERLSLQGICDDCL